jgi:hypothetical protein
MSVVEPFRVRVTAAGNGYLAEANNLDIAVGGSSPAEAAEKARAIASELMCGSHEKPPATLIVRIDVDRSIAFVMRPFGKRFQLLGGDPETLYLDSDGRLA